MHILKSTSQTQQKAENNLSLPEKIISLVPGLIAVYNIHTGMYIYVNETLKKILGYTPSEFINGGIPFASSLVHPDDAVALAAQNQKALQEVNSPKNQRDNFSPIVTFEYRMKHKNGTWRWLHTDGVVFDRNDQGEVMHVMNISIDITDRRERELKDAQERKKYEETQSHLAAIVESSNDAIVSKTLDGIITSWNKAAKKTFGYAENEAIGKHISLIIPSELRKEEETIIATLRKGQFIEHFETVRVTKAGKKINVSLTISPIKDDQGIIIGASKIARDITERKKTEEAMNTSQERLQLAIEAGKIGIWDWDIIHNKINWTDQVYEIHGVSKKKRIGELEKYQQRHHPEDAQRVKDAIQSALDGSKDYNEEFRILTPSGKIKWVETKAHIIRDADGKPLRMLGATTDITQRKMLEQQKDEFIGIASHELKTPVTSIKAYTQVLERRFIKEGNESSALLLKKMDSQLDKLTDLISDLLDITKIETGKLQFDEGYFAFNELVEEITDEMRPTTEKHKLILNLGKSQTVYGDRNRVGQVLTNLISNAIKYSPNAADIIISTRVDKKDIIASVQDFGLGIPKINLPNIFQRFYRVVSNSSDQTYPGMGLGLYISSEIVKRQRGKIWVESEQGKGSTFSFCLPIQKNKTP